MKVQKTEKGIVITIANKTIRSAAKEHPETPIRIKDIDKFKSYLINAIETDDLINAFDNAIEKVAETSDDNVCTLIEP